MQALGVGQTLTQSFNYTISDGNGGTSTSTLTITITGTNDGPVANADTATIAEDTVAPATGNVLTNDTDVDTGDVLTVTTTGAQAGTYGSVTIGANGAYSYTLNNGNAAVQALGVGQTLTEIFSYSISDGHGGTSTSTLTITITGTNDGPVANADTATVAEDTVAPATGNVLTNDADIDTGDVLTVTTTGGQTGTYGSVTIAANGAYSYTLNNANPAVQALGVGQTLTETFNYTISDGHGGASTSTLTITITGTNDGPIANPDTNTVAEDAVAAVTGNVLTNDTDADTGDTLTVTTTGAQVGTYGTVTIAANGAYSFTLDNGNAAVQALGVGQTLTQSFNYTDLRWPWWHLDLDLDHHHHRHQRRPGRQPGHQHRRRRHGCRDHRQRADQRHGPGHRRRADRHYHGRPGRHLWHGHHQCGWQLQLRAEQRQCGGPGAGRGPDPDRELQLHDLRRPWRHVDLDPDHHHYRHQRRSRRQSGYQHGGRGYGCRCRR